MTLSTLDTARRPALAVIVAERIREAIVFGDLKLGEAISEDRLATLLGVSRTPVREALNALSLQGLVTIAPQRGSFVFQPTETDVATLCEYRLIIELQAMRLSHLRNAANAVADLERAARAQEEAAAAGDAVSAARGDAAFHNALLMHCGNPLLLDAYSLVAGRIGAIRYSARDSSDSRRRSDREHHAIVAAFAAGNLAEAERVLTGHVMNMQVHFADVARAAGSNPSSNTGRTESRANKPR